jgi:hypothetical protein
VPAIAGLGEGGQLPGNYRGHAVSLDPYECPRTDNPCGQLHYKCGAHRRKEPNVPCGGDPMRGTEGRPRCRHHCGRRTADVMAAHNAEQQALAIMREQRQAAEAYGLPDLVDPLDALHRLADEMWAWKEACRALVGTLNELRYRTSAGEQLRSEIALYERSQERAAKILSDLVRLGIEKRLRAVTDAHVTQLMWVLDEVMRALGHDPTRPEIAALIAEKLRALSRRQDSEQSL